MGRAPDRAATPQPATTPEPPRPLVPADRADATPRPFPAELRAIEAQQREACEMPIGSTTPAATLQDLIRELTGQIERASAALRALESAYAAAASTDALRAHADARYADALDSLAARMVAAPIALPLDLQQRLSQSSPSVQAEVREQVEGRTRELLAHRARAVWCLAVARYRRAAAGPDADSAARAREQLARYGDAFVSSCDSAP